MSVTSVTASIHPPMIIAGECVVSMSWALGFISRMISMMRCCHSMWSDTSGSSMSSIQGYLSSTSTLSSITSICFSPLDSL